MVFRRLISNGNEKVKVNKPVYLGLKILEISMNEWKSNE